MKKISLYLMLLCGLFACSEVPEENKEQFDEEVKVRIAFTLDTTISGDMSSRASSNQEVFKEFHDKMSDGCLLPTSYNLSFTNIENGTEYIFNGTWEENNYITLRTGTYNVKGYSTAEGENIQEKCSLTFDEQIEVSATNNSILLTAIHDSALIVFNDANIQTLSNFNGISSTPLFEFNTYRYAFVKDEVLYDAAHKDEAYLSGTFKNGTEFVIYTGKLRFQKSKYYVYNSVENVVNIPSMEEGDGNIDNNDEPGTVKIVLPPSNEIWYTSTTGEIVELSSYPYTLVSNTYVDGRGKYTFAEDVTDISNCFGSNANSKEVLEQFASITLPASITKIDRYAALFGLKNVHSLVLPANLTSLGVDIIGAIGENLEEKHIYFLSDTCPSVSSWRTFWNLNSTLHIHYPKGSDYSAVSSALEEWIYYESEFLYEMVETTYNIVYSE